MNIPTKYDLIWYSTSISGSWMSYWNYITFLEDPAPSLCVLSENLGKPSQKATQLVTTRVETLLFPKLVATKKMSMKWNHNQLPENPTVQRPGSGSVGSVAGQPVVSDLLQTSWPGSRNPKRWPAFENHQGHPTQVKVLKWWDKYIENVWWFLVWVNGVQRQIPELMMP